MEESVAHTHTLTHTNGGIVVCVSVCVRKYEEEKKTSILSLFLLLCIILDFLSFALEAELSSVEFSSVGSFLLIDADPG